MRRFVSDDGGGDGDEYGGKHDRLEVLIAAMDCGRWIVFRFKNKADISCINMDNVYSG